MGEWLSLHRVEMNEATFYVWILWDWILANVPRPRVLSVCTSSSTLHNLNLCVIISYLYLVFWRWIERK